MECKCLCSTENYQKTFDESLKKRFLTILSTFKTIISISLFCCCEQLFIPMNIWMIEKKKKKKERLEKKIKKEDFYSHLNMENVAVADYTQAKRVCENLKITNLGDYPDLYV